jgi:hypothetical protein
VTDPEEVDLIVTYISTVLKHYLPAFNRAKRWHDYLFRPRYYYTTCPPTLEILARVKPVEMARHVISLDSIVPLSMDYLWDVECIVRRLMDAGLYVVLHKDDPYVLQYSRDVYKGGYIEVVMEGIPFEQEYVTDFDAFHRWLDKRLPKNDIFR